MARIVVAVADDAIRTTMGEAFRALGHEVEEVGDARACLGGLSGNPPQALVLDPRLPGLADLGVLHLLRRSPSLAGCRVSLLARDMDPDLWEVVARPMFDFVIEEGSDHTGALVPGGLPAAGGGGAEDGGDGEERSGNRRPRTKTLPTLDAPPPPPPRRRILVVEDEPTYGILLGTEFQALGWTTLCAASAEAALDMLRVEPVDAILSDINLPGLEGNELAERVRADYPEVKFVLMTGMPRDRYPRVPAEVPILPKPINVRELMQAMRFLKQG